MILTDAQLKRLQWLNNQGGSGFLDQYGRIVAAGEPVHQGAATAWLNLIVKGLIEAKNERFVITESGRRHLMPFRDPVESGGGQ